MPYKEGQLTLMGHLGMEPMRQVMKTRLFGGPYIRLYDFFDVCRFQFESGAILGRARCNKLNILAKMFVLTGEGINKNIKFVQQEAKQRLEKFRNEVGKEPDTFFEFIQLRELGSTIGLSLADFCEAYGNKKLMKVFDEKWQVEKAEPFIKLFGYEGIGFGSLFPELTEKMYRNAYENIDMDVWFEARAYGLVIPEKPTIESFEEREQLVLLMVALYAQAYYPELLDPLDLQKIIEEEIEKSKEARHGN